MEKIKKIFTSPLFETTLSKFILITGIIISIIVIFIAGEEIGFKRAQFSYRYGENYNKIFGERRGGMGGMMGGFESAGFPTTNGAAGKIISIKLPTIIIGGQNGVEKVITITNDSTIRRFRDTATSSDLKIGDTVTVLGSPNENGWIVAKLIRIMPAPNGATAIGTAPTR